ncbi:MAG: hypothetical protein IJZ93_04665 [Clostridia bacterium]|nr:hypothetical protein [Clostridia bacterium]
MKKILSILILIAALLALTSCGGDEISVPDGMQLLTDNDKYTVFVPERWVIDDEKLSMAHDADYKVNDNYEAFYAQIKISTSTVDEDANIEAYANEYIEKFKNEYGDSFELGSGIQDYKKGTVSAGKEISFSLKKGKSKDLYRVTFMKKGTNMIEISYFANEVEGLFDTNLEDYEATRENIILK